MTRTPPRFQFRKPVLHSLVIAALSVGSPLLHAQAPAASPAPAQPAAAAGANEAITMNFVNADIPSVVNAVGRYTGKTFIIDPRVMGNMNIISQSPVSKEIAYQILLATLRGHGFAAVEDRGVVRVVPEADAKTSGIVVERGAPPPAGDRIVTQVFALQNESAAQLATVLRPLIAPNNFIGAYPGNNMLVITDYAQNLTRIKKIIDSIDVPSSTDIQTIKVQHASAVDLANMVARLMPETATNPANPGSQPKLSIGVDSRTNSLVVRADTPALTTRLRTLVASLDVPTSATGNINVVYLRNAEAAKVADTLRGLMSGSTTGATMSAPSGTAVGAQGQVGAVSNQGFSGASFASAIQAYPATNSLIITAPDHVYNSLRTVIDKLDARRAQVQVEALIAEVNASAAAEFGVQWQDLSRITAGTGAGIIGGTNFGTTGTNIISSASNIATVGQGLNLGVVRGTVNIPGVGTVLNLGALARALEAGQKANILSTPSVTTLDNEEARFIVGQNVPFVTGSFTQANTGSTNPFQTIERKDIGLTLKVTPTVTEGGTVKMKVFLEVSSVAPTTTAIKSADLITNKRSIEVPVLVEDGETLVIGGLITDDTKSGDSQVPLLGRIPLLGGLFKYQTRSREKNNLMVFIKPTVLRDAKSARQVTGERYDFIRNEQAAAIRDADSVPSSTGGAQLPAPAPKK